MNRATALVLFALAAAAAAAFSAQGDAKGDAKGEKGERAVQIVYESDTRGYYLPCG